MTTFETHIRNFGGCQTLAYEHGVAVDGIQAEQLPKSLAAGCRIRPVFIKKQQGQVTDDGEKNDEYQQPNLKNKNVKH